MKHEARGNAHLSWPKHSSTQTSIPKIGFVQNIKDEKICWTLDSKKRIQKIGWLTNSAV